MPTRRRRFARRWRELIREEVPGKIDYVVGPAIGGLIPAYETSRHLGVPAIWVERENGEFRLRRFEIEKGARVVIVEDIVTTGLSIRETIDCLTKLGAEVVAAACIIDRSAGKADVGAKLVALARICGSGLSGRPTAAGIGSYSRRSNPAAGIFNGTATFGLILRNSRRTVQVDMGIRNQGLAARLVRPQKSYLRSLRYFGKRILRIRATPHALALGSATGIFAAFSPALGLSHFLLALLLALGLGRQFDRCRPWNGSRKPADLSADDRRRL